MAAEIIEKMGEISKLEKDGPVLNTDFSRMNGLKDLLIHIRNVFQSRQKRVPEALERSLEKMKDALKQAKDLIDEDKKQRERQCRFLFGNSKHSSKIRVWKAGFYALLQELEMAFSMSSNTGQIAFSATPPAERLLQPVPESGFVGSGIQSARKQLQTWLQAEPRGQVRVIGVHGNRGVGKTSLLKIIYNTYKQEVSDLFDVIIWITASPGNQIEQLQASIAEALNLNLEGSSNADARKTQLNASLRRRRFLLILDNMDQQIDLNEVGVKTGDDTGSKILISGRDKNVVEGMGSRDYSRIIEPLSPEEARELFRRGAFTNGQNVVEGMGSRDYSRIIEPLSPEEAPELFRRGAFTNGVAPSPDQNNIEDTAREIASTCGGIPLAINAVAAAMSFINTEDYDQWSSALASITKLKSSLPRDLETIDPDLYPVSRWCYDKLPDSKLKICFLNCAAFLPDKEIAVETLLEMWEAEGLLEVQEGTPSSMDARRRCINELVSRCLVERVEYIVDDNYHSVEYLKIHGALRGMAIYIGQTEENCLFVSGQQSQNFPNERDTRDCKRISVGHTAIKDLPTDLKCSNLESLILASNIRLEEVPKGFLSKSINSLKVLDLSRTSIRTLPTSVDQLEQLVFLNLTKCIKLVDLPDSLCKLSSLQVLNLNSCSALLSLPSNIAELKNLKHLRLDACYSLNGIPQNLSQLTSLNTLILPLMESICALSVEDLSKLSNLMELTTVVKSEDLSKQNEVGTKANWLQMRNLTLEYDDDADADRDTITHEHVILKNMGDMENLQNFHLIKYQGVTLPNSVCQFQNMKMLLLHSCYQLKAFLAGDNSSSASTGDSFPKLEKLVLRNLLKLESLAGPLWKEGTMSELQLLVIFNCPLLKELPSGMKLPHLKELHITMCNEVQKLDIGSGGFPMLETVILDELNMLQSISDPSTVWTDSTMSKLQMLEFIDCPLLKRLPTGMETLSGLRKINGELDWWQSIIWENDDQKTKLSQLFMII